MFIVLGVEVTGVVFYKAERVFNYLVLVQNLLIIVFSLLDFCYSFGMSSNFNLHLKIVIYAQAQMFS